MIFDTWRFFIGGLVLLAVAVACGPLEMPPKPASSTRTTEEK